MSLIELKDIKKTYPDGTRALRGVSLSIDKGEFVAIMGPSGSGKSTLLHIIGFLDTHTEGEYLFDGTPVEDRSEDELARIRNQKIGFVFQSFNLLPKMTVLENVKLPLMYSSVRPAEWDKRAREAIEKVKLSNRILHESSLLSGGEKQRVAIARALVNDPEVIFADEPTGNLDSKSGEAVMQTIQSLHDQGHTILLITHETYTSEYANRVIHLKDGLLEEDRLIARTKPKIFRK